MPMNCFDLDFDFDAEDSMVAASARKVTLATAGSCDKAMSRHSSEAALMMARSEGAVMEGYLGRRA